MTLPEEHEAMNVGGRTPLSGSIWAERPGQSRGHPPPSGILNRFVQLEATDESVEKNDRVSAYGFQRVMAPVGATH